MKTKINLPVVGLFLLILLGCKKNKEDKTSSDCSDMSGNFEIQINGNTYTLVTDTETNFTILYNWSGDAETHFMLDGKDQNGKSLQMEMGVPGIMSKGSHTYSKDSYDYFGLDLYIDNVNYFTTTVNFEMTKSKLDSKDNIYKPIKGTFNGTAKKYNTILFQEPSTETFSYTGSFCLNGVIIP